MREPTPTEALDLVGRHEAGHEIPERMRGDVRLLSTLLSRQKVVKFVIVFNSALWRRSMTVYSFKFHKSSWFSHFLLPLTFLC